MLVKSFNPAFGLGQTFTATATTASNAIGKGAGSLCLTNLGDFTVYVAAGIGSATAATIADYPLLSGNQVSITKFKDCDYVAVIAPGGNTDIHVIQGEGI